MEDYRRDLDALAQRGMLRFLRTVDGAQGPRVLLDGREVLLLCSNNYLGLAGHPRLCRAAADAALKYGSGSGASRLVSGSLALHEQLEQRIAAFKGTAAALVFNSGYAANTGILQGLSGPEDLIFSDALNHASIIDGCRLSRARTLVYPHGDVAALEDLMKKEQPRRRGRWFIVTDGVFSMDGDLAPLNELVTLKERYDALLMVDDAHGTGVLGDGGRGSGEEQGCLEHIDLHMGTLGKALGGFGAFVAAAQPIIDVLINRSRPFIFSTSLPPAVLGPALTAFELVDSEEGRRRRVALRRNREVFAAPLRAAGLDLCGSTTQIVPILTGAPQPTMDAAAALLERGIFVQGIRPPTVPEGRCRLRATVMADHDPQDLETAAATLVEILARRAQV
ncbi:8-amino-7-oxononanoate synthase [Geoalkalibacter halelectricus]|uniref:8-amino-7-ketopelargonate synthase n=1 Tax=Geoalkalibacter halelectricus TaxID=2847045 RepID=A0ABY5ZSR1_9BACT|nr:8-amino-7-oxononanoate synthase [Geoalkalibacter halelectricus]MDO3379234.1 8-amino-7-oxononanoate synthase [Geoalkalibacter halelectricus]UWZ80992.1 8-amino-7-oxononanoate synthase [Geoalkalibacter halelectricus]